MDSSATKPKNERATHEQLETYIAFCQAHPEIGKGKNTPKTPQQMQDLWKQLADQLNACRGPARNVAKWKETLGVWKSQLRTRARRVKMNQRLTGGGPGGKPMSDFEEKALAILGLAAVDGVESIKSLGIGLQIQSLPIEPSPSCSSASLRSPPPSPSPLPSSSPVQSPNPSSSPCVSPSSGPENQSATNSDASTARPSRATRNKLISTLIANIADRNAAEEHRQLREVEKRQEHREVMQAIQSLTSTVAELINVLQQNPSQ